NAAQTVRRSPGAYAPLADAESVPLEPSWAQGRGPVLLTFGHARDVHPHALEESVRAHPLLGAANPDGAFGRVLAPTSRSDSPQEQTTARANARTLTDMALAPGSSSLARLADGTAIDAGGLLPDLHDSNSWVQGVGEVDPLEMLEVQLCNETAPFILISRLRGRLAEAAAASRNGRAYVVNVSAMEGVFGRGYKGPGHPHTNMAKAAVNMLTRTSAREMFETDSILMTSVDTGWITDERPHPTKVRLAEEGFHAPLDLVDGAARVYDPIVRGEAGEDLFGVFLKDYKPSGW
ncbi:MAG: short-chain dehydrogenase, partial [Demequinaceae bacterium]|nr:short-chain dehydrogenase [Demequinaceae bacterium]